LPFGHILWGQTNAYPQEIVLHEGSRAAGLFHIRIA
jgi:hypothetical protein